MIDYFIIAIIAAWIGWRAGQAIQTIAFHRILEDLGVTRDQLRKLADRHDLDVVEDTDTAEPDLENVHIKLEQHGGQIYAFRSDTDQFLGQGSDRESLIDHLKQRMTNVRLIIDEGGELLSKSHS